MSHDDRKRAVGKEMFITFPAQLAAAQMKTDAQTEPETPGGMEQMFDFKILKGQVIHIDNKFIISIFNLSNYI